MECVLRCKHRGEEWYCGFVRLHCIYIWLVRQSCFFGGAFGSVPNCVKKTGCLTDHVTNTHTHARARTHTHTHARTHAHTHAHTRSNKPQGKMTHSWLTREGLVLTSSKRSRLLHRLHCNNRKIDQERWPSIQVFTLLSEEPQVEWHFLLSLLTREFAGMMPSPPRPSLDQAKIDFLLHCLAITLCFWSWCSTLQDRFQKFHFQFFFISKGKLLSSSWQWISPHPLHFRHILCIHHYTCARILFCTLPWLQSVFQSGTSSDYYRADFLCVRKLCLQKWQGGGGGKRAALAFEAIKEPVRGR